MAYNRDKFTMVLVVRPGRGEPYPASAGCLVSNTI